MSTVGIKELKNRLPYYLRRTKRGEEIIVTERGKAIAVIQRIESAAHVATQEARLAKMAAEGLVSLPTRKASTRIRAVKPNGRPLSQIILEDRR